MPSLLRNVGVNFGGFILGKAAAGLAGVLLLRLLKPEAAGVYGAALGVAAVFASFADLGLSACLTREVGQADEAGAQRIFAAALLAQALQIVVAGVGLGLLFRLQDGAGPLSATLVLLAFGGLAAGALTGPCAAALRGREAFGRIGLLTSAVSLLNAAALGLVFWMGPSPMRALAATLASNLLGLGLWLVAGWRAGLRPGWPGLRGLRSLWRVSLPFALVSVANQLYVRQDLALLTWLSGTTAVGFYAAGVRIVDLLVAVLGALSGPLYARLARLHGKGEIGQARRSLARALRVMAALCLPLGVGGSLLALPLMRGLYGPAFARSAAAFAWLAWVPALIGIHGVLLQSLNASGRTFKLGLLFVADLLINALVDLWAIPHYQEVGAAAASVLGEVVNLLVAAWILKRAGLLDGLGRALWPALPAALGMGALLWTLRLPCGAWGAWAQLAALVPLGALTYAVLLLSLGYVGADERALWARLRGRTA